MNNFRKQIASILSSQEIQIFKQLESKQRNETETQQLKAIYATICTRLMLCKAENAHRYVERAFGASL